MILDAIKKRRSDLAFSKKSIEPEILSALFEAAILAPSSMNIQPWRFIYVNHGEPEFQQMLNTLSEGNQRWAKNASALILSIAQVEYTHNDRLLPNAYAWHDTGMANAHLMLQATSFGLATHPMGGFDHQKVSESFNLPKEYQPVLIIALGYKGDETNLPDDLLKRQTSPRKRKPIEEVVFKGSFGF